MKIKNIEINRPYVTIKGKNIEFKKNSINLICGKNGSGKTTLLEEIVFSDAIVEFDSEYENKLYKTNRTNLFSYVPQDIKTYKSSVLDYITKGNKNISNEEILNCFSKFSLLDIDIYDRFDTLSGGEKMKIAIISAILKNTPYIFMDEPTNHLDDQSVEVLTKVLEELAHEKTFIIVCHDKRVNFKMSNVFILDKNTLVSPENIKTYQARENALKQFFKIQPRFHTFRKKVIFNYTNLIAFYLFLSLLVFLVVLNDIRFTSGYSYDNGNYEKNIILSYPAEYIYGETNQIYVKSENLSIKSNEYEKMITYNDISDISNMDGVSKILILDPIDFQTKLYDIINDGSNEVDPNVFSIPQDFINVFPRVSQSYLSEFGELLDGRYPNDGKREICITKQDVALYNIDNDAPINKHIEINNVSYKIVGILSNTKRLYLTSFEETVNNGFYKYSEETFDDFAKKIVNCNDNTQEILIYTNQEKSTLDSLIESYPATNYNSFEFTKTFEKEYNKEFLLTEIIPINLILSFVIGIIMLLVKNNQIKIDRNLISDYSIYYVDKKTPKTQYFIVSICVYIILIIVSLISNVIFSKLSYASNLILLIDMLIAFLPSVFFALWRNKNVC